ncbi:RNA polymerase sigma factor [Fulvivirga ligni]|uniref:RNA polymerase sigma factor n=1 Tax=Fulvivirga ligni TaxID=2904246 RepID=UPI001F368421|nr:sigma-70 family RNA polymerase sigma factor [Fulvivirga ligni]UII23983.1 sigma-70 family RNA polymerase sigma factor [Fulvivirga ligni]
MEVARVIDQLYKSHFSKMVVTLAAYFRLTNLELAEDIVQDTFVSAFKSWSKGGIPDHPEAWLFKVCKNKGLNEISKLNKSSNEAIIDRITLPEELFAPQEIRDNELRMLFASCHPDFPPKSQIILTLKVLASLKEKEIATSLGMKVEAVKKNLVRTRKLIKDKEMQLKVPFRLQSKARLKIVHQVLYLIFNEGYKASEGDDLIRQDLCQQAIRLTQLLLEHEDIATKDTMALFSLMIFNIARFKARLTPLGEIIELKDQDRSLWDKELISLGIKYFNQSQLAEEWSKYHYEAAIASLHTTSASFEATNWPGIVHLYQKLLELHSSPFISLNYCIALHFMGDTSKALNILLSLKELKENPSYLCALALLYEKQDRAELAINYYLDALQKVNMGVERKAILRKIDLIKK